MPIHEYQCEDCGQISEFLIGVNQDTTEIECTQCGSSRLSKVISKSFVSTRGHFIGAQGGKTCCGREERCDSPPCTNGGACRR
jgi:putative FmdB family regulatory protein